ncbi:tetratricopeptide repeat protein [Nostoc sp.]|uniref:tetratricopeptide repeat protein n=1 Tax=Nostoc sp. TaxID=1180 RepID=UPI002FF6E9AF
MNQQHFNAVFNCLTERRREVLLKLLANEKDEAIANSLYIKQSTVRKHREEICKLFGLNNEFPDERRSKFPELIALFAKYKPELLNQNTSELPQTENFSEDKTISENPDFVGREDAIANFTPENDLAELLRILQRMQQHEQKPISSANLISIPPTLENWQGRNAEVKELQTWLVDTKVKTIGIQGLSGVGKSWLASYMFESTDFEAKFWADVRQGTDFTVFAQNALMKLAGTSPEQLTVLREPEQLIFALLDTLKKRPCLLVIDNLETLLDQDRHFIGIYKDFFIRWIENGAGSKLLLTTQTQPEVIEGNGYWLPLQGLEAIDGAQLLQELEIVGSVEELENFSKYLNGHPKMLRLVASKLKAGTHIQEAEKLGFRQIELLLNKLPMSYRDTERVFFAWILQQHFDSLTSELQSFLLNLSLYRTSFDQDAAAIVLTENEEPASAWETIQSLDELKTRSLIDIAQGYQRYEFHPFVFQYIKAKVGNQSEKLRRKVIDYYKLITPDISNCETLEDVKASLEIFYQYCELQEYTQAFYTIFNSDDYDNSIDNFLSLRGYNAVRASLYENLLDQWQHSQSETWEFMVAITCLGDACYWMGQFSLAIAHHQQSLKIAQNIGDFENEAGSLVNIGLAYIDLKDYEQAFEYTREGVILAAKIGHNEFKAHALNNLGIIYFEKGVYEQAIKYYEASRAIKKVFYVYQDDSGSLINLGDAYRSLGENKKAIKYLKQGIKIAQQLGHHRFEANGWFNLGFALKELGRTSEVKNAWTKARELFQAMELNLNVQRIDDEIHDLS